MNIISAHIGLAIIIHTRENPLRELVHRFSIHEHKRNSCFTPQVVQTLDNLGASHTTDSVHAFVDLTACFMEGFQKPNHKHILEFLIHAKLSRYPPAVAKTCIEYISFIANGKPDKFLIPIPQDRIIIEGQS